MPSSRAAWPLLGQEQALPGIDEELLVALRSKDDHEAFAENRLHPVVHPILQDMLGFVPPEPAHTVLDVIDAWTDRHPG